VFSTFITADGLLLYIKALYLFLIFIFLLNNSTRRKTFGVIIMFLYFLLVNSLNIHTYESIKQSTYFFAPIFLLPVGFMFFKSLEDLNLLLKAFYWMMLVYLINLIFCSFFNIGASVEEKVFQTRFFQIGDIAKMGAITYLSFLVVLVPLIRTSLKSKLSSYLLFGMTVFFLFFLILELKRMTIIIVFLGYLVYLYWSDLKQKMKLISGIIVVALIALIALPYYEEKVSVRFIERESKFRTNVTENEARYIEFIEIWHGISAFKDPVSSIFGDGLANYEYESDILGERNIHVDYTSIAKTGGLVGLGIYLYIMIASFIWLKRYYNQVPDKNKFKSIFIMARNFVFLFFVAGFAGGHIHLTFRGIVFLFVGAVMGVLYHASEPSAQIQESQHAATLPTTASEEN